MADKTSGTPQAKDPFDGIDMPALLKRGQLTASLGDPGSLMRSWSGDGEIMSDSDASSRVYADDYEFLNRDATPWTGAAGHDDFNVGGIDQRRILLKNKDGSLVHAAEGGFDFIGAREDTMYPVSAKPNWLNPEAGLFYIFDANGKAFWRDNATGTVMSPLAPYLMPSLADLRGERAGGINAEKNVTSGLGLVSDGLSIISGTAMTLVGAGLVAAPEPTTLTKWAGVPLTVYGAAFTTKSVIGFGLNATNLYTALRGSTLDSEYMAGSALEWAVKASGGPPEAERVAVAVDMAWGLVSGRVLDARLATGAITNPRVAALLQAPLSTTVQSQALIRTPTLWKSATYIEPIAGTIDLLPKSWKNIVLPLAPHMTPEKK